MSRFQFVADNSATFEVKRLCELVQIERSSYYAWKAGAPARAVRAAADAALVDRIRVIHTADNTVGAPRVTAELNDGAPPAERVNHKRVARLMADNNIAGYVKKRRVRTTIADQADQLVPDLLKRNFTADAPNQRYVGDITYLPLTDGTNLYLATVIDCYSRRLAGWALAGHMRTDLVTDALKTAAATRGSLAGAIFHSDHGSVYTSKDYAKLCSNLGVTQSMGAHRVIGRQRAGRVVQRRPQTRGPSRRRLLDRRAHLPPRGLQVAHPLQHQATPLLVPLPVADHLRDRRHSYAANRRVITPRVQHPGVGPIRPSRATHQLTDQGWVRSRLAPWEMMPRWTITSGQTSSTP